MKKDELKQILKDQKEELKSNLIALRARRILNDNLELKQSRLAKVIMGIRRSGKSSICNLITKNTEFGYVNFDDERLMHIETKDLNLILEILLEMNSKLKKIFFDEIQNVAGWELFINRLLRLKYDILITGSNGKLLSGDLATHLTGRQLSFTIYPLNFKEYLSWKLDFSFEDINHLTTLQLSQIAQLFEPFFQKGGFPQIVEEIESPGLFLRELYSKIISRDIVQRYNLRTSKSLLEMASYLIQNSSQQISLSNLKAHFGITSIAMVQKYIKYLEDSFLIFELRSYSYKLRERSSAPRKIYACDLGMMKALWSKPTDDLGAKLETLVFLELLKNNKEIYMLKENGYEIDFCVLESSKIHTLIQVCYDLTNTKTREREIKALVAASKKYKVKNLFIITRDHDEIINENNVTIQVISAAKYFLLY